MTEQRSLLSISQVSYTGADDDSNTAAGWNDRDQALREQGVAQAAQLIRDSFFGYQDAPVSGYYNPYDNEEMPLRNAISVACGKLAVHLRRPVQLVCWILFMLTFFEPPHWCRDASDLQIVQRSRNGNNTGEYGDCKILFEARGETADGEDNQALYPNFDAMWLTIAQSHYVEMACIGFIAIYLLLKFGDDGFKRKFFFYRGVKRWMHCSQIIILMMLVMTVTVGKTALNPFLRMAILGTFLRGLQREVSTLIEMIPDVLHVLYMLGIIIFFYAWFGVVIFAGHSQADKFPNLFEGMFTLWICVTTANYPDVSMDSYNDNRLVLLYWVSFMVVSFFYIMNLVLAICTNQYDKSITNRQISREKLAKTLLTEAFTLLDHENNGTVSRESMMNVMAILNHDIPEIKAMSSDEKSIFFELLDKDGSEICQEEFMDLGLLLLLSMQKETRVTTLIEDKFPFLYHSRSYAYFSKLVKSPKFDSTIEIVLALNALVILVEEFPALVLGHDLANNEEIGKTWETIETVFTTFYVLEVLAKVLVNSWKKYTESARNVFDFLITCLSVLATVYVYCPSTYNNKHLVRFIVMARVCRLLRLLFRIDSFRLLYIVTIDIVPAASNIFLVLLFVAYFFASIGMLLYGGYITRDPSNPLSHALLRASDFTASKYWANNFNDVASGMNVVFNLLVVNNWTTQLQALEYVTGGKSVRLFFLLFHLIGVTGISNVITSVVINSFFQQLEVIERRYGDEERVKDASIRGSRAYFAASILTGTETGVHGTYSAQIKPTYFDVDVDERRVMRRVFGRPSIQRP